MSLLTYDAAVNAQCKNQQYNDADPHGDIVIENVVAIAFEGESKIADEPQNEQQ